MIDDWKWTNGMSNVVKDRSYAFAVRVVNLYKYLSTGKKESVLS